MTIKERINADFIAAYKAQDMVKKNFLGVVKGAIQNKESDPTFKTGDEGYLAVIKSIEKSVKQTIEAKTSLNESTLHESMELEYLAPYLPKLMSEEEIRVNIHQVIIDSGETNAGKIMGLFNKKFAGQAFDNKVVSKLIMEELA